MNAKQMKELGAAHADKGGKLCPTELRAVDAGIYKKAAELFPDAAGLDIQPFRFYNEMRGAFNKGWMEAHIAREFAQA